MKNLPVNYKVVLRYVGNRLFLPILMKDGYEKVIPDPVPWWSPQVWLDFSPAAIIAAVRKGKDKTVSVKPASS